MIWSLRHTKDGQDLARRDYWRDDRDRIKGWKKGNDVAANPLENGRGDRYDYDPEGQLTLASYQVEDPENNPTGAQRADEFHYDALGNRVGWNTMGNRGEMYFVRRENNGLNQYHSWANSYQPPQHWGSGMFYDDNVDPFPSPPWVSPGNGVLMQDGYITGGFNALNQPVGIWSNYWGGANWMFFGYDPLGRCVKRRVGPHVNNQAPPPNTNPATYYYYDGWNLIQEGPGGSVERTYVHGNRVDEIVASVAAGGSWLYHHYDARGHCIVQTNVSGGLQEQYDYDAFGWPYFYTATGARAYVNGKPGSPSGNRFLFTGREWIRELKLYDYRARLYQPELGRFLQPDPKHFAAGDYNLYRYCHNDPVNKSDPMGLWPTDTHNQIIDKALKDKLTDAERKILKDESKRVDRDQSKEGAYKHGMRSPGQSVADARKAHGDYIANNLKEAVRQAKEGHRTDALKALGRGIHALSDSTSPTHEGYQVWNGLPNPFTQSPTQAAAIGALGLIHAAGEAGPISDAKLNESSSLINNYYDAFVSGTAH